MTALEILRDIIEDGHLSETNMHRGRKLLDFLAQVGTDHTELLASCREEFQRGQRIPAVKRFRSGTGCGLREAMDAVGEGKGS
jgi:ribosomal protein L7/L12